MSADNQLTYEGCPICGGQLEATRTEHLINPILDEEGIVIHAGDSWPSIQGGVYGDTRVFCQNGHTHEEMTERINGDVRTHPEAHSGIPWDA